MSRQTYIVTRTTVDQILDLRQRILRAGLPVDAARFYGDDHPYAAHFSVVHNASVIGCATVTREALENQPGWRLRGMAVEDGFQNQGIGAALLRAAHQHVEQSDNHFLWCCARQPAIRFYERNGWRVTSDVFDIPTAGPHVVMVWDKSAG